MPDVERQPRPLLSFELTTDGQVLGLFQDLLVVSKVEPVEPPAEVPAEREGEQESATEAVTLVAEDIRRVSP